MFWLGISLSRQCLLLLLILQNNVVDAGTTCTYSNPTALKSINGDDVCAVDIAPAVSFKIKSELACFSSCIARRNPTACFGANYWKASKMCDIFDNDQTPFVVQSGCKYRTVSIISTSIGNNN